MIKFELEEFHRNTPDDELIGDLKKVALVLNKDSVTLDEYEKNGRFSPSTLRRRFGSWFKALEKAGLEKTRNLGISENDLITDLKRVAQILKKDSVTIVEYETYGNFSASTFHTKFGSWFNALRIAELKKTTNLGVSDEEYFKNLESVWVKLGRQPKYKEMQKPLSEYCAGAYEYRFGTWRKALKEFIKYINSEEIPELENKEPVSINKSQISKQTVSKHKTSRSISWRLRFIIMRRDNFKCKICGRSPATQPDITLQVDHIRPWSDGGETAPENLQTLCDECNIGKSNLKL